jgi:hypothetical protein
MSLHVYRRSLRRHKYSELNVMIFRLTNECICSCRSVRKVAVHLQKVLEVISISVYTGLNPLNFIREHFLQIYVRKVAVHL